MLQVPLSVPVPSPQQKTASDYVDGVLELSLEDGRGQPQRRRRRRRTEKSRTLNDVSPRTLRRRIEEEISAEERQRCENSDLARSGAGLARFVFG